TAPIARSTPNKVNGPGIRRGIQAYLTGPLPKSPPRRDGLSTVRYPAENDCRQPLCRSCAGNEILRSSGLGVGIAGCSVDGGDGLLRVAFGWGEPKVPVWGRDVRLSAPAAAFLNAW